MAVPAPETAGLDFAHESQALGRRKLVHVVPPQRPSGAPTPILILLHPFAGNRTSWLRHAPDLIAEIARDTLVAMPECGRKWFIDDHAGTRYETYVARELLPLLRTEFDAGDRGHQFLFEQKLSDLAAILAQMEVVSGGATPEASPVP